MMSFFRRAIRSKYGPAVGVSFIAIMAAAFAAGDISNQGGNLSLFGPGSNDAAKIGDTALTTAELDDRVKRVFENNRRENPELTMTRFVEQGGFTGVLDQLVARIAFDQFGKDQGLVVSKRLIDAEIARIPAFQTATGQFSQSQYDALLKRERMSDRALRDDIASDLITRQLAAPAIAGATTPAEMVRRYAAMLLEERSGRAIPVPSIAFMPSGPIAATNLTAFYKANDARFALPELRQMRYALVDAAMLGDKVKPSEAEIAAYYKANSARYAPSESRSVEQLVIAGESGAKALAAKVKAGQALAAVAQGAGLSTSAVGPLARDSMAQATSAEAAGAIFGAAQGATVGPFRTGLGWALYRVTLVRQLPPRTLEQVRGEIVDALTKEKTRAALASLTEKIDDAIGDGATFDEIVKANGLTATLTPPLAKSGAPVVNARPQQPAPEYAPLASAGFGMEQGDDPQVIAIVPEARYALVTVGQVIPSGPAPLDQIRPDVENAYRLAEGEKAAKRVVELLRAKIAGGTPLDKAIAETGAKLPPPQPISARRGELGAQGQQVPPALSALFSMKAGASRVVPMGNDRGYLLLRLDRIVPGDATGNRELLNATREGLARVLSAEYVEQFGKSVQRQVGVTRNEGALRQAEQTLRGIGPAQ